MLVIVIFALLVLVLIVLSIKDPAKAFGVVVCMYGLEQWLQASNTFFLRNHSLTNITVGVIVVIALLSKLIGGSALKNILTRISASVLVLFVFSFISILWSPIPSIGYEQWSIRWPYIIVQLLLAPLLISKAEDIRSASIVILILGSMLAILLLFTVEWRDRQIVFETDGLVSEFGNPLAPAQMSGVAAFIALFVRFQRMTSIWALLKWIIVAINMALVVRTGSRGQLLACVLVIVVVWPLYNRIGNARGLIGYLSGISLIGGIVWFSLELYWKGQGRFEEEAIKTTSAGRFDAGLTVLQHWISQPHSILFGLGNSASFDPNILGIYPHFVAFEVLGEEGLFGFSIFLAIILFVVTNLRRSYKEGKHTPESRMILVILASMWLYALIISCKQGNLIGNLEVFTYSILIGKISSLLNIETAKRRSPIRSFVLPKQIGTQ